MCVLLDYVEDTYISKTIEYSCFFIFSPFFFFFIKEYSDRNTEYKKNNKYYNSLNRSLVNQTHNPLFYEGNVIEGAKTLTKEVSNSLNVERCSIWMYNIDKTSIICQQLYFKDEDTWYQDLELKKKDYKEYFDALDKDPIIIADDAITNCATKCFADSYLIPLGIKSMLDVPIIYRGEVIGVICIETFSLRSWKESESNFAQALSSLYSFAYSVSEANEISKRLVNAYNEINKKNTYLEHAAKIIRHDMHSGINTYIPRGITSLERRLNSDIIKIYKLETPLKLLKEGLKHAQKVYKGAYEFTNLVKQGSILEKKPYNIKEILKNYLNSTAYESSVAISEWMPTAEVNEPLFCTAIDNLIRNGLKYNDSEFKMVAIYMDDENVIAIQDNGRGMTQEEFERLSKPYSRRNDQKESGTGLGLNICSAILNEHGFTISCEKLQESGTKIRIKIN
jgi:K+-sensing histidine kinase KdpD